MTRTTSAVAVPATAARTVDRLDAQVLQMFALVREAVSGATDIFLAGDRQAARSLRRRERLIDRLHEKTERDVIYELLYGNVDTTRQQRLLVILRILPELERSGDLAEHIASHAAQGLREWLSPRARLLVAQMGALGSEMWALAGDAYATTNVAAADLLRARDDEVDDLHVSLTAELAAAPVSVPVAIQMALVARYFERLGDHAVNVTRRLQHPTSIRKNHGLGTDTSG
jgi:phosphate transport system protein